jgi:alkylation response protein AidB-like acyl-CoA dehydrogenase
MRGKLAQKGWLTIHWPKDYGGQQASSLLSLIFNEEMSYHRAPGRDIFGARMLGPTLMIYGTEEQNVSSYPPLPGERYSGARATASPKPVRTWPH